LLSPLHPFVYSLRSLRLNLTSCLSLPFYQLLSPTNYQLLKSGIIFSTISEVSVKPGVNNELNQE
jgi:hypothetical protein